MRAEGEMMRGLAVARAVNAVQTEFVLARPSEWRGKYVTWGSHT